MTCRCLLSRRGTRHSHLSPGPLIPSFLAWGMFTCSLCCGTIPAPAAAFFTRGCGCVARTLSGCFKWSPSFSPTCDLSWGKRFAPSPPKAQVVWVCLRTLILRRCHFGTSEVSRGEESSKPRSLRSAPSSGTFKATKGTEDS